MAEKLGRFKSIPDTTTIRPHADLEGDMSTIYQWCNQHGYTFNSVINSLLPALAYSLSQQTFFSDGKLYIKADWGDILIRKPHEPTTKISLR